MLLTKTEIRVLEFMLSELTETFTIREIARKIKKDIRIVHTAVKSLDKKNFLLTDKHKRIRLNYHNNISDIAYAENLRAEKFLKRFSEIRVYIKEFLKDSKYSFFVLLIFGSYASGSPRKNSDVDVLAILPKPDKDEEFERLLYSKIHFAGLKWHINVIGKKGFNEMIAKRGELNVVNETLNNHIILHGAEAYYKLLLVRAC